MFYHFLPDQLYRKLLPFIYNLTSVRYKSVSPSEKKKQNTNACQHRNTVILIYLHTVHISLVSL